MYELCINVNRKTEETTAEDFRKTILALTDLLPIEQKSKINLHYTDEQMYDKNIRKMPYIIYSRPKKTSFKLYGYGKEGRELLEAIKAQLRFEFSSGGITFQIKGVYINALNALPKKLNEENHIYRIITPLVFFTGGVRRWLDWQLINLPRGEKRDTILKEKVSSMIRDNLKHQLCTNIKFKEWKVLDSLEIKWEDFKLIQINLRGKKEYGIYGTFSTNFEFPRFIGRRTGLGQGELFHLNRKTPIVDTKNRRKKVA